MAGASTRETGVSTTRATERDDLFLLVGSRDGAIAALRRRGLGVVLVAERRPSARTRALLEEVVVVDFADPAAAADAVARRLGDRRPRGVLAAIERSVPSAAALAERYDLPGLRRGEAELFRDKVAMKSRAAAHGIPIAAHRLITADVSASQLVAELGLPLVLKPRSASGSRDVVIARSLAEVEAHRVIDHVAEEFVRGVEMSVESIVRGGDIVFHNPTEYLIHGHANIVPAGITDAHLARVLDFNARVLRAFGVRDGMTHLELFITQMGEVFGEIAARPPGGYLMNLLAASYGFDPWEALVDIALGERARAALPTAAIASSAALIVHPGEGEVARVRGLAEIAALPGVREVHCTLRPGDRVRTRRGLGEASGRVLITAEDREHLVPVLRQVQGLLDLEMAPIQRPTCAALIADLGGAAAAIHALDLALPGCRTRIRGDDRRVIAALADYFGEHRAATPHAAVDLEVLALGGESPRDRQGTPADGRFDLDYQVKPDDARPSKEEWIDLEDGRVVRKRKTGVHLIMSRGLEAVVGPIDRHLDQVINFVNHRLMQRWTARGGVLGHASGVARGDRGVILCGRAGAGKSTLALQLLAEDPGLAFVSNDRLVLCRDAGGLSMIGIPKHPRVNPGTILHNQALASILDDTARARLGALDPAALWTLEEKYDAVIDRHFGPGRFRLAAAAAAILFLRWRPGAGPAAIDPVDPRDRPDLLALLRKRLGLFFWPQRSAEDAAIDASLAAALAGVPAFEVSGGVDFAAASRFVSGALLPAA